MRQYLLVAMFSLTLVGFVIAEEFNFQITAIGTDGTATGKKIKGGKGGFGKAEEITVKIAKDVKVQKGKYDVESKGYVAEGDDLKLAGLQAAVQQAQNGSVLVSGKSITDKDSLEITIRDGKPSAKLNGKDVPFTDVTVKGKAALTTHVTTGEDGVATTVLITEGGGGGKKKGN
jgi:hypothetical protein